MGGNSILGAAVAAALAMIAALATPAAAHPCPPAVSTVSVLADLPGDAVLPCTAAPARFPAETLALQFEPDPAGPPPRYLLMNLGRFDRVAFTVEGRDGSVARSSVPMADAIATSAGPTLALPLPRASAPPARVEARIEGLSHKASLESLHLSSERPDRRPGHVGRLALIAVLIGMLAMPIVFDALFWRVLRDRFIVWHAAMTACFIPLVALRSGIVNEWFALDPMAWRAATIMTFGAAIAACLLFTRHFIEADKLGARQARAMEWAAAWALAVSALQTLWPEWMVPAGLPLHGIALLPVMVLWFRVVGSALARGSRAVRFQLVGWIPLTIVFLVEISTELMPGVPAVRTLDLFYLGLVCEATVTALGVTDRFLTLRRERDSARRVAAELGDLVERDPLTGLMNRRGLAKRFPQLRAEGFSTFALLDLDRFKDVNDTFGHAAGDEVLRTVAAVLAGERKRHSVAVRMGGEEFLLFLRGERPTERAERIRRTISLRVAREVTQIDRVVTASMGMIEIPDGVPDTIGFDELYARADKLLYEAKEAGRNRSMHERLTLFAAGGTAAGAAA
ncbi:GGDEF domain-containing protein [Pelagerythrobacter marinus]|uniref:GGDEF domain-containing protein n=1 Tax=Pelagerythrobacter marinus TaxID=538382 RepID=UPI002036F002|nr:diguanylate cyclase [Pelagerythrobacter marinus]USA39347.1 GGDEF domain-containing protein [Pelagerythrobacter marinus]WPZ06512.1 diguanylate cyclase [Pelagerythrobacter marinus]